jgi:hypothetical protein
MRPFARIVLVGALAAMLIAAITAASLIGLNAECNGSGAECPRSAAYRGVLLADPVVALALLLVGAIWALRRRTLRPLILAEASVLALSGLVDAVLDAPDIGTVVLLVGAAALGRAALPRRARGV